MQLVLARDGEALVAPGLVATEAVAVIPAPGPLTDVARQRAHVADLQRRHVIRGLREHRVPIADAGVRAEGVQGSESAHIEAAFGPIVHAIETVDGLEVHEHVRDIRSRPVHDSLFYELQEIGPSGDE